MRFAALMLLAAGCASTTGYTDFLHQAHQIECDARVRCGCASDRDVASCVSRLDNGTNATAMSTEDQIARGQLTYDATRAAACLDGIRGAWATCSSSAESGRNNLTFCDPVNNNTNIPDQADGTSCAASVQCHSGLCVNNKCIAGTITDVVCIAPLPL